MNLHIVDIKLIMPLPLKLYAALVGGPLAANILSNRGDLRSLPVGDQMKYKHKLTHTTPGAIASSTVLVSNIHSMNSRYDQLTKRVPSLLC